MRDHGQKRLEMVQMLSRRQPVAEYLLNQELSDGMVPQEFDGMFHTPYLPQVG